MSRPNTHAMLLFSTALLAILVSFSPVNGSRPEAKMKQLESQMSDLVEEGRNLSTAAADTRSLQRNRDQHRTELVPAGEHAVDRTLRNNDNVHEVLPDASGPFPKVQRGRFFRICPHGRHEDRCLSTRNSDGAVFVAERRAAYRNDPRSLWQIYQDYDNHFVIETALEFQALESESEDCGPGYIQHKGLLQDVQGLSTIQGKGGGQHVSSCDECGQLCDNEPYCRAYECSPSLLQCWLSNRWDPTGPKQRDFNWCAKSYGGHFFPPGYNHNPRDLLHVVDYGVAVHVQATTPNEGSRWHFVPQNVGGRIRWFIQPSQRFTDEYLWVNVGDPSVRMSGEKSYWTIEEVIPPSQEGLEFWE